MWGAQMQGVGAINFIWGNNLSPPPHSIYSLLDFSMEPHVCISYSGHWRIESMHLGNSCLSLTHRHYLSGWPCSQALIFNCFLTELHPLTLSVMANSVKDHARDDESEDYQSFLWVDFINAIFEWINTNLRRNPTCPWYVIKGESEEFNWNLKRQRIAYFW